MGTYFANSLIPVRHAVLKIRECLSCLFISCLQWRPVDIFKTSEYNKFPSGMFESMFINNQLTPVESLNRMNLGIKLDCY